jgi:hypothetical protein
VRSKDKWTKPHLGPIRPGSERWREYLPHVRELTQKALDELEDVGPPDVLDRLRAALELIDAEIAEAAETADRSGVPLP